MGRRKLLTVVLIFAVVGAVMGWLLPSRAGAQADLLPSAAGPHIDFSPLTQRSGESIAHIFPTVSMAAELGMLALPSDTGPLLYHSGGSIMSNVAVYAIFWLPASGRLQNGNLTSMSTHYQTVQKNLLNDYGGHGIDNNNTQYYQIVGTNTTSSTTRVVLRVSTLIPMPIQPPAVRTVTHRATASPTLKSRRRSRA